MTTTASTTASMTASTTASTTSSTAASTTASTTPLLIRILVNEIAIDGGACLVTSLKDYIVARNDELLHQQQSSLSHSSICRKSKKKRRHMLNSLLIRSNIGKPRLLAFLESHPDVFYVDRTVIPHWVKLVQEIIPIEIPSPMNEGGIANLRERVYQKALYVLRKRQASIDRRYQRSIDNAITADDNDNRTSSTRVDGNPVNTHWLLRQCFWDFHFYLRVCNFYMNPITSGYQTPDDVNRVGSREWEDITLQTFEQILCTGNHKDNTTTHSNRNQNEITISSNHEYDSNFSTSSSSSSLIYVQRGKASLKKCSDDGNCLIQPEGEKKKINDIIIPSSSFLGDSERRKFHEENIKKDRNKDHDDDNDKVTGSVNFSLMHRIDQTLTDIICEKDGGHQIRLQLLLHRYPHIKELLCGRDLFKLYSRYKHIPLDHDSNNGNNNHNHYDDRTTRPTCFFESILMFQLGPDIILRSKRPKTNPNIMVSNCINGDRNKDCDEKRMKVDEIGLYSVTNTKWGRAISNLLIQACHQTNLFNDRISFSSDKSHDYLTKMQLSENTNDSENENALSSSPSSTDQLLQHNNRMVIDLTASVGGMTLALAKSNFFDRILALEIDKGRAALCQDNMKRHGFCNKQITGRSIVEIRHEDSVQKIPFLPRRVCFVIDPPWGGYNYKQKVRRQQVEGGHVLKLGDSPLEDVLALISHHNSPCVVGLRLPVNFLVQSLLNALAEKEEDIQFKCITRRKISVQLFVILYFQSVRSTDDHAKQQL